MSSPSRQTGPASRHQARRRAATSGWSSYGKRRMSALGSHSCDPWWWIKRRNLRRPERYQMAALGKDSHGPESNPCIACSVQGRGSASPSVGVRSPRHGLMSVTAETADFEVAVSGVEGVTGARRGLSRSFETEHALIPSDTRQTVSFLPSRQMPDRTAIDALASLGALGPSSRQIWSTGSR